jgi:hypothetical protein
VTDHNPAAVFREATLRDAVALVPSCRWAASVREVVTQDGVDLAVARAILGTDEGSDE